MNNTNWRTIGITALALLIAAGVGFMYLVPSYQGALADLDSTETVLATTQSDLTYARGQLSSVQSQLSNTQSDLASMQGQLSSVQSQLSNTQGQLVDTKAELVGKKSELASTKDQLADVRSELSGVSAELSGVSAELVGVRSELSGVSAELEIMQGKYPPRRFSSRLELESWLGGQPNPSSSSDVIQLFRHALDLQQAAADDGFLISADYMGPFDDETYYVWCSAVLADGSYYWWNPDTDDIYYALNVNYF